MKKLSFEYRTAIRFSEPVQQHDFVLRCLPRSCDVQTVRCRLDLEPDVPFDVQVDNYGNRMAVGTVIPKHDFFAYTVTGTATVDRAAAEVCTAHPLFRWPTKLTALTPEMKEFLADSASAGMREMVLSGMGAESSALFTCQHLMHQVHNLLEYKPGSTTVETTAQQAFEQRAGVCQDYAHLLISLIRACNVPVRYASGLILGEGATHAWVEAHLNGVWVGFDPTRDCMVDDTYLTLAVGRDWSDCPIERGTMQGFAEQDQTVYTQMEICE